MLTKKCPARRRFRPGVEELECRAVPTLNYTLDTMELPHNEVQVQILLAPAGQDGSTFAGGTAHFSGAINANIGLDSTGQVQSPVIISGCREGQATCQLFASTFNTISYYMAEQTYSLSGVSSPMTPPQTNICNWTVVGPQLKDHGLSATYVVQQVPMPGMTKYYVKVEWAADWTVDQGVTHMITASGPFGTEGLQTSIDPASGAETCKQVFPPTGTDPFGDTVNVSVMDSWGYSHSFSCLVQ